ncbi:MAG: TetR/AcrR family transcriptional regulator [Pseudomonadota bacterium]
MARPQATPEQRAALRRRIQRAAAEIYTQQGIAAITARAVAKDAGVSVGTIYAHFDGLPGLMQSLWTGHVERFETTLRNLAEAEPDPVRRLRGLMAAYLTFGIDNAELYKGAFMFVRPDGLDKPEPDPFRSVAFGDELSRTIRDGQMRGQILDGDPDQLAQFLWAGLHGCLAIPVNFDRLRMAPATETGAQTIDLLVQPLVVSDRDR